MKRTMFSSACFMLTATLLIGPGADSPADDAKGPGGIVFSDVTREAGLFEPLAGMMGHGAAWGDFDGDGRIDLYVGGFCDRPNSEYKPAAGPVPNRLFRNLGKGRFEQAKQPAVEYFGRTSGAVFADLDNNGTLELYGANNALPKSGRIEEPQRSSQLLHNKLFRNDQGLFIDISEASGACPASLQTARNIGVFDFDGDGKLDLFVVEDWFRRGGDKARSILLRNKGNLKFEDVTSAVGLPNDIYGLGLAVADLNGDGRPDFFVAHSNRLFLSQKDGKYREAVELKEILGYQPLTRNDWACGAAFGDVNGDGLLDLIVTHHHEPARIRLFLNQGLKDGIPQFREVSKEAGLGDLVPTKAPHVEIQDFDNDGRPDIYVSAAWLDANGKVTPLIYRNLGVKDGIPRFAPPRPIQGPMVYYPAGPSGDYDNDGRIDLFLVNWFQGNHCRLMHNDSPKRHWLNVTVRGKTINRMGIGAQVRLYRPGQLGKADTLLGFQEVSTGYGYASGQPALCHFGLGDESTVDVQAKLPNGKLIAKTGVRADQNLVVEEP